MLQRQQKRKESSLIMRHPPSVVANTPSTSTIITSTTTVTRKLPVLTNKCLWYLLIFLTVMSFIANSISTTILFLDDGEGKQYGQDKNHVLSTFDSTTDVDDVNGVNVTTPPSTNIFQKNLYYNNQSHTSQSSYVIWQRPQIKVKDWCRPPSPSNRGNGKGKYSNFLSLPSSSSSWFLWPSTANHEQEEQRKFQHPGLIYIKIPKAASSTLAGINMRIAHKVGQRYYMSPNKGSITNGGIDADTSNSSTSSERHSNTIVTNATWWSYLQKRIKWTATTQQEQRQREGQEKVCHHSKYHGRLRDYNLSFESIASTSAHVPTTAVDGKRGGQTTSKVRNGNEYGEYHHDKDTDKDGNDDHRHYTEKKKERASPYLLWTFVRRPEQRSISEFFHFHVTRKKIAPTNEGRFKLFLQSMEQSNYQFNYLSIDDNNLKSGHNNKNEHESSGREHPRREHQQRGEKKEASQIEREREEVHDKVLRHYHFIGIVERMEESLAVLYWLWKDFIQLSDLIVLNAKRRRRRRTKGKKNIGGRSKRQSERLQTGEHDDEEPDEEEEDTTILYDDGRRDGKCFQMITPQKKYLTDYILKDVIPNIYVPQNSYDYTLYDMVSYSLDQTIEYIIKVEKDQGEEEETEKTTFGIRNENNNMQDDYPKSKLSYQKYDDGANTTSTKGVFFTTKKKKKKNWIERTVDEIKFLQQYMEDQCWEKTIFPCSSINNTNGTRQHHLSSTNCYLYDSGCGYPCIDNELKKNNINKFK